MSRIRKIAALALAATALATTPATASEASAAPAPCRAQGGLVDPSGLTLVVTGQYVARPTDDVSLTCHVVQYGSIVASVHDGTGGGVAVVSGAVEVPLAPYSVCYEVSIWDITGWGYTYSTNCP